MLAFQAKHLVCDFILQTRYQVDNKGFYGGLGGLPMRASCSTPSGAVTLTRAAPPIRMNMDAVVPP